MSGQLAAIVRPADEDLREWDARVDTAEDEGVRARWEYGRALLRRRVGKQLPAGLLDEEVEKTGKSRSELKYRVQFAEAYTADQVANALATFKSWSEIIRSLSAGRDEQPRTETPPLPVGVFSTIVADPPWDVKAGPAIWGGDAPSQALEYPTMDVDAIAALDVRARAADDAHLYLWTINKYVENAYTIARAWGFKPSTLLTWCKPRHGIGLGGTYVLTTEHVLFATRGSLAAQKRIDTSWFEWPRRAHSVKPIEFYELLETVSPGPYLEMFARQPRDGWEVWGNEL